MAEIKKLTPIMERALKQAASMSHNGTSDVAIIQTNYSSATYAAIVKRGLLRYPDAGATGGVQWWVRFTKEGIEFAIAHGWLAAPQPAPVTSTPETVEPARAAGDAPNSIPQNVIEALAQARRTSKYNMLDQRSVTEYIWIIDFEARNWLVKNEHRYMDALNAMGEYISKPKPATTDKSASAEIASTPASAQSTNAVDGEAVTRWTDSAELVLNHLRGLNEFSQHNEFGRGYNVALRKVFAIIDTYKKSAIDSVETK